MGANNQGRETRSRPEEKYSLVGALKAQRYKFSGTDGVLKITKGSMMILKAEHTTNLYKVIGSVVIGDTSVAKEEDITRLLAHVSWIHERAKSSIPTQQRNSTRY